MRQVIIALLQLLIFVPVISMGAVGEKTTAIQKQSSNISRTADSDTIAIYLKAPLFFIENQDQVNENVRFYERGRGHAAFFTEDGVVFTLGKTNGLKAPVTESIEMRFVGASKNRKITPSEKLSGHVNYFKGNDRSKWHTNIPTYGAVTYRDIYKNIDVKFYGNNRNIEHDVIVRPGGDPSLVKFAYDGIKDLRVNRAGELEVILDHGKIIERKPVIYQELDGVRVAVKGSYRLLGRNKGVYEYSFTVASYDHTRDLVIDPVLEYSTYLGGSGSDNVNDLAIDSAGNVYVIGYTDSADFPVVSPIQGTIAGSNEVFVTKIDPTGSAIVYSSYLGGSGYDLGNNIAVDSAGNVYLAGYTKSTDFPVVSPIQGALSGGNDLFLTKIDPTGSAIVYSTYIGGTFSEYTNGLALDSVSNVYLTGYTNSTDFPLVNPIQFAYGGLNDVFVTKVNSSGSAIVYSTYLGGNFSDIAEDIAVDASGNAYITGTTLSANYPLASPLQPVRGGGIDAFVTKIDAAGAALVFSTFLGGSDVENGNGITVDGTGNVYIGGTTRSLDFPTVNPLQGTFAGGTDDAFITKIDGAGASILYSTYLGGTGVDQIHGINLDGTGNIYVNGYTGSTDFPTASPLQGYGGGSYDGFITEIDPTGLSIIFSTYLGGSNTEYTNGLAIDASGNLYAGGFARSTDFPVVSPIQGTFGGGYSDGYVLKISPVPPPVVTLSIQPDGNTYIPGSSYGYTVTATNTTAVQQCFQYWENVTLPGGSTYPGAGSEILGPVDICLNAGASQAAYLTRPIAPIAPLGTYTYNVYVGAYLSPAFHIVIDEAHPTFDLVSAP